MGKWCVRQKCGLYRRGNEEIPTHDMDFHRLDLHCTAGHCTAAPESFLEQFFIATAELSPEKRGKYLEEPPEGAMSIEAAHQVTR